MDEKIGIGRVCSHAVLTQAQSNHQVILCLRFLTPILGYYVLRFPIEMCFLIYII